MSHNDALKNSSPSGATTNGKSSPHTVRRNDVVRRLEGVCKNIAQSIRNTNADQQNRNQEICSIHQAKPQAEKNKKTETLGKNNEEKGLILKESSAIAGEKTSIAFCSCTVCSLENEQNESTLKELQIQIQNLAAELGDCKSENQLLKKDINRAKNFIKREIGRNVESFEDLVKKMTEDSWIGQQEKIVSLKKELRVLKEALKEKGLKAPSPVRRYESVLSEQVPNDRKVHWRLKLERQSIQRQIQREKQDLLENRERLKEKYEGIFNRNKELEQQVNAIREEIEETKTESNGNLIPRLQEIEKETKFCLDEKSKLRRCLEDEETKEKQLLNKIEDLEDEINSQKKTFEITEETLSRKRSNQNALISSLTTLESEASFVLRDIDKTLNEVAEEHKKNSESLKSLIDHLFIFEELFSQQRQKSPSSGRSENEIGSTSSISVDSLNQERVQKERTDSISEPIPTTTVKDEVQVKLETNAEMVMQDTRTKSEKALQSDVDVQQHPTEESVTLRDECDRFAKLFKAREKENIKKSSHVYQLLDSVKEKTEEMLKNNTQLWKIAAQIKILLHKNKKLRKLVKNYEKALGSEHHGFYHATWNDLINKGDSVYNILGKENKFLKALIIKLTESKAYDFDLYTCACKGKKIFMQADDER